MLRHLTKQFIELSGVLSGHVVQICHQSLGKLRHALHFELYLSVGCIGKLIVNSLLSLLLSQLMYLFIEFLPLSFGFIQ